MADQLLFMHDELGDSWFGRIILDRLEEGDEDAVVVVNSDACRYFIWIWAWLILLTNCQ